MSLRLIRVAEVRTLAPLIQKMYVTSTATSKRSLELVQSPK